MGDSDRKASQDNNNNNNKKDLWLSLIYIILGKDYFDTDFVGSFVILSLLFIIAFITAELYSPCIVHTDQLVCQCLLQVKQIGLIWRKKYSLKSTAYMQTF